MSPTSSIASVLHLSVSPAALISAVSLLMLCATNRMAHLLDRIRAVHRDAAGRSDPGMSPQVQVLLRRARLLRVVLISFLLSILCGVLVVISLFVGQVAGTSCAAVSTSFFLASLLLLAAGLLGFMCETALNLSAVILELESPFRA